MGGGGAWKKKSPDFRSSEVGISAFIYTTLTSRWKRKPVKKIQARTGHRCSALPTELSSQLGAGHIVNS